MTNIDEQESNINTYSSTFVNHRGKTIFCNYWEADQNPRALVFVAHGFAEHCLLYDKLAKKLVSRGFFVFSHDHVGHGQSGGSRVHIDTFHHYIQDVFQHVDMMEKKFPDLPVFLCGHSMGGTISILTALKKPEGFKGIVLVGPAVALDPHLATPFKISVARMLRWILPHFPVGAIDYNQACSSPQAVKAMLEDPLRWHGFCKAGFSACFIDAWQEIHEKDSSITFPFMLLQGEADKICDPAGATALFERASSEDKMLKFYPKAYHALFLEPNGIAEQVTEDIAEWLAARS